MKRLLPVAAALLPVIIFIIYCMSYYRAPDEPAVLRTRYKAGYDELMHGRDSITEPLDFYELIPGMVCININTADAETLEKLPGIGSSLAEAIIEYRTKHGPFEKPEDLTLVKGIGEGKYAAVASLISTNEENQ